jgi:hypothetical protein
VALRVRHGMGAGEQSDEAEKGNLERHDFRTVGTDKNV